MPTQNFIMESKFAVWERFRLSGSLNLQNPVSTTFDESSTLIICLVVLQSLYFTFQLYKLRYILILKTIIPFISQDMFQSIHTSPSVAKSIIKSVNILNVHVS